MFEYDLWTLVYGVYYLMLLLIITLTFQTISALSEQSTVRLQRGYASIGQKLFILVDVTDQVRWVDSKIFFRTCLLCSTHTFDHINWWIWTDFEWIKKFSNSIVIRNWDTLHIKYKPKTVLVNFHLRESACKLTDGIHTSFNYNTWFEDRPCPFIHILSWFYPNFIQILSR